MPLSRNERRQFDTIAQALAQDRDFAASMALGRTVHRRLLTALFYSGVVMTLAGIVLAQLAPSGIVLCFYGLVATAGSIMGHRRMVIGTS